MNNTKPWYFSKILGLNFLIALAAILGFVTGPEFPIELSAEVLKWLLLGVAIVNALLRLVTNSAVKFRK